MNYHIEELSDIDWRITMLASIFRPFLLARIPSEIRTFNEKIKEILCGS